MNFLRDEARFFDIGKFSLAGDVFTLENHHAIRLIIEAVKSRIAIAYLRQVTE
jgi:hypothetical protein